MTPLLFAIMPEELSRGDKDHNANEEEDEATQSHQGKWEVMFQRLLEFQRETGHCLVPNRYKKDHRLGSWVSTQRRQYKAFAAGKINTTTLSMDRIRKLESIGFAWSTDDPRRVDWCVRFKQLCIFQKEWGHTLVPMGYKKNPSLGNWVSVQRQEFRNLQHGKSSKMTPNRVKLLESIGFIWKAPRGARRKNEKAPLGMVNSIEDGNEQSTLNSIPSLMTAANPLKSLESLTNSDLAASLQSQQQQLPSSLYHLACPGPTSHMLPSTRSILLQRAALRYKREVLQLLEPQVSLLDDAHTRRATSLGSASDLSSALKLAPPSAPFGLGASSLLGGNAGGGLSLPSTQLDDPERLAQLLLTQYR